MAKSKYPYIPDKSMYAAVMGACRYIRETGWFNKAVRYYAEKYNVDEDELAKNIRERQSVGQKNARVKKKFYWYALEYSKGNDRSSTNYFIPAFASYSVKKATSEDNAMYAISKTDDYYSEYGTQTYFGRVEKFEKKDDAISKIFEWKGQCGGKTRGSLE